MIKYYVDFNDRYDFDSVNINMNAKYNKKNMQLDLIKGQKVLVYSEDMECEAVLEYFSSGKWTARLLPSTIVDIPPDQWDRLENQDS